MRNSILLLALLFCTLGVFSQDMDAGISIMGRRDPRLLEEQKESKLTMTNNLGFSGKDPLDGGEFTINTIMADGDIHFYKTSRIFFRLAYGISAGPAKTVNGPGDIMVMYSSDFSLPLVKTWNISVGIKISSGSANIGPYPMAYEPALGSNDLLLGFGKNFGIANLYFGYQKSFGRSVNKLTELKRGDDVMLRAGITEKFETGYLQAEILGIKRIQESNVVIYNSVPRQYFDVDQSNELQLNVLGKVSVQTSRYISLEALAALPLLTRDSNIDGLKRAFSISLSAVFYFKLD